MITQIKKHYISILIIFFGLVLLTEFFSYASGTYKPPRRDTSLLPVTRAEILFGIKLFNDSSLFGKGGKSCIVCHDKGKANTFRRLSLKKKSKILAELINICMTNKDRSASKELKKGSKKLVSLAGYIISRYRLPSKSIDYIRK